MQKMIFSHNQVNPTVTFLIVMFCDEAERHHWKFESIQTGN